MDAAGRRNSTGLRDCGGCRCADDLGQPPERRTAADFRAVSFRGNRDCRFPVRAVGSNVAAGAIHRTILLPAGIHPLHLQRAVSGSGIRHDPDIEDEAADGMERAAVAKVRSNKILTIRLRCPRHRGV